MKTPYLKPCPFCGGEAEIATSQSAYYEMVGKHGHACISLECRKCNLDMYEHSFHIKNYEAKVQALAKKWNRRATHENA